jgi:OOP family OmpA-OmpF porin
VRLVAALLLTALPAWAQLELPAGATRTISEDRGRAAYRVAVGPVADGVLPFEIAEGRVTREVWRFPAGEATVLDLIAPLRAELAAEGWDILLDCRDRACGGFEFRFEIDVTPAPGMFVNLGAYRYLAARRGEAWTTILVSRSGEAGFVQVTRVAPAPPAETVTPAEAAPAPTPVAEAEASGLGATLAREGRAVLEDLTFETGSTDLGPGPYASLRELAGYLTANPDVTVGLVGHTDAAGDAAVNMTLSERRAEAARAGLIGRHGIDPARVETHGVGYFAPRGPNDTPEGREANRRVEVVITSTP